MSGGKAKDGVIEQGGARYAGWMNNIAIVSGTTNVTGDSIKITGANGTALSPSNYGWITLPSTVTNGQLVTFQVTAPVTINLTGATWGNGGKGDLAGALLRVLAINDNGTLKWGVAKLGGRTLLLAGDTNATQASIDLPEEVLCTSTLGSSNNRCREIGFVRADFDDTGGSSEDLWTLQTGIDDIVTGQSADGYWQPWNTTYTGFSADPTATFSRWTQVGRLIKISYRTSSAGTSNATDLTMTLPAKAAYLQHDSLAAPFDNSATVANGVTETAAGSTTLTLHLSALSAWTNAGTKYGDPCIEYEVGPVASFF